MDEERHRREMAAQRVANKLHDWDHVYHWHSEENEALEDNVYICQSCGTYSVETDMPLMWGCKGAKNVICKKTP